MFDQVVFQGLFGLRVQLFIGSICRDAQIGRLYPCVGLQIGLLLLISKKVEPSAFLVNTTFFIHRYPMIEKLTIILAVHND